MTNPPAFNPDMLSGTVTDRPPPLPPPPEKQISATVLSRVVRVLHRYLGGGRVTKSFFNAAGLHVLPANFYSTVPSVDEVNESFEQLGEEVPYLDPEVFDADEMVAFLDQIDRYGAEFDMPKTSPTVPNLGDFYWDNGAFSFSDALAYYSIIRDRKPNRIIEVGCGFSTLVAAEALARNGTGELICVEPYPMPFLRDHPGISELVETPVQSLPPGWFDERLEDGDIFFIDSTHTVKIGSDCLHLYLRVLPALRSKLLVHAHDIFLPFGFPPEWALDLHCYWTEQYLLMAFLVQNPLWKVRFGSYYHHILNPERLDSFMRGKCERGGSSFWFEKIA